MVCTRALHILQYETLESTYCQKAMVKLDLAQDSNHHKERAGVKIFSSETAGLAFFYLKIQHVEPILHCSCDGSSGTDSE